MPAEEKFNQNVWWILQEIKNESRATPKDEYVRYDINFENKDDIPSPANQRRAVRLLANEGAIEIQREKYPLGIMKMGAELYNWKIIGYSLDVLQPKFDKLYLQYEKEYPSVETRKIDITQKMEITAMPEVVFRNAEDSTLTKGKKRIRLPKFKPTDWAKITIRFLDEQNVLINADKKEQVVADYEALGFADEKRNKPNLAWKFFYGLAQNKGETKQLPTPIPDTIKQQKRQLSDRLKTIFKNDTDPFYDPTDTHIYKIKINLIPPQYEGEEADELGIREHLKETMTEEYEG